MSKVGRSFYHFDRIRINSEKSIKTLEEKLPIKELEKECRSFMIKKPYAIAKMQGKKARLEIIVASRKALELLHKYDSLLSPYAITYLEITKDAFRESEKEAVSEVKSQRGILRKLWSNSYFIYEPEKKEDYIPKDNFYNTPTIYCGGRDVQYVLYARPSKLNGKPYVHGEWKLKGPSVIKKETGITTTRDLVSFDIKAFMDKRNEKFLRTDKQIDLMKLGKWLTDCNPRQRKYSDRKRKSVQGHAIAYCVMWEIYSFAGLIQHFRTQKKEIKKKVGRRNAFERKIMLIDNYSKFARIIDG
jgi:hypothetical protein